MQLYKRINNSALLFTECSYQNKLVLVYAKDYICEYIDFTQFPNYTLDRAATYYINNMLNDARVPYPNYLVPETIKYINK